MITNTIFKTRPLVVHAQGPHINKPYWKPIRDKFFQAPKRQITPQKDLTIITWNNGHEAMGVFEKSMEHLGLSCMVLGKEVETWVNSKHKPLTTYNALKEIKTKYVMGVDSRDAILLDDPTKILERFKQLFDCELVFSSDLMNWPNIPTFKKFEDACAEGIDTKFKYLNGGIFIGETEFCKAFFKQAVATPPIDLAPKSEQGILKQVFQEFYPKVQLDYQCQLFQNIGFVLTKILEIDKD